MVITFGGITKRSETADPHSTSLRAGSRVRCPGFPVETRGVDQHHEGFLRKTAHAVLVAVRMGNPGYARSKSIPKREPPNRRSLHFAPPDFLLRAVALINFMRFPLRKTAPVVLASAAK